jgi:hypothetical protein
MLARKEYRYSELKKRTLSGSAREPGNKESRTPRTTGYPVTVPVTCY